MTGDVLFITSGGGHVDETSEVAGWFVERTKRFWTAMRMPQSEALLEEEAPGPDPWVPELSEHIDDQEAQLSNTPAQRDVVVARPRDDLCALHSEGRFPSDRYQRGIAARIDRAEDGGR